MTRLVMQLIMVGGALLKRVIDARRHLSWVCGLWYPVILD